MKKTSLGERLINEIIKQGMFTLIEPKLSESDNLIYCWAANAPEQLEAVVEEFNKDIHYEWSWGKAGVSAKWAGV